MGRRRVVKTTFSALVLLEYQKGSRVVCACLYAGPGPTRWWAAITVTEVLAFLDMTNGAPAREDGVGATITPIGRRVLWGPAARRGIPRPLALRVLRRPGTDRDILDPEARGDATGVYITRTVIRPAWKSHP